MRAPGDLLDVASGSRAKGGRAGKVLSPTASSWWGGDDGERGRGVWRAGAGLGFVAAVASRLVLAGDRGMAGAWQPTAMDGRGTSTAVLMNRMNGEE